MILEKTIYETLTHRTHIHTTHTCSKHTYTQHNTAQHNTTQHTQHNTTQAFSAPPILQFSTLSCVSETRKTGSLSFSTLSCVSETRKPGLCHLVPCPVMRIRDPETGSLLNGLSVLSMCPESKSCRQNYREFKVPVSM